MVHFKLPIPDVLQSFVKEIDVIENNSQGVVDELPFFADGYPGIMYQQSPQKPVLIQTNKGLSELFLYGQTIKPIAIKMTSPYKAIVLQLFPFVPAMAFDVNPRELNDDCHNLLADSSLRADILLEYLKNVIDTREQVELITVFLEKRLYERSITPSQKIKLAVDIVLLGQLSSSNRFVINKS